MSEEDAQIKKVEEDADSGSDVENEVADVEEAKAPEASGEQDADMDESDEDKKQRACRQSTFKVN